MRSFPLLLSAVMAIAVAGPVVAQNETGADIPKNAYHGQTLTPVEQDAIAEEENVTPNDGKPSVPPPVVEGVIPDAVIDQAPGREKTIREHRPTAGESEADVILDDSMKNDRVTSKDLSDCIGQWDPQTQMSKKEWAASCRTTLEYYPEKTK